MSGASSACAVMLLKRFVSTTMTTKAQPIRTAACLIIGDEILNGKIKDTNSATFAEFCFDMGINLRRIAVVPDVEEDIVDVLRDLKNRYDFIITTGGIGPTHDDITYASIAKLFNYPLQLDESTVDRMNQLARVKPSERTVKGELDAQLRMALLPSGPLVSRMFPDTGLWVPIVGLERKIYIFPGIPSLFKRMLDGLRPEISARVDTEPLQRRYVSTRTPESNMAQHLETIHRKYTNNGVKLGSYPHVNDKRNTVSIIGPTTAPMNIIVREVEDLVGGHEISKEEEATSS